MKYHCRIYPRENHDLSAIHEIVNGKFVTIEGCNVGERGHIFAVNGGGVHTSTIISIDHLCEGDLRITTQNSVYDLTRIDDDEAGMV